MNVLLRIICLGLIIYVSLRSTSAFIDLDDLIPDESDFEKMFNKSFSGGESAKIKEKLKDVKPVCTSEKKDSNTIKTCIQQVTIEGTTYIGKHITVTNAAGHVLSDNTTYNSGQSSSYSNSYSFKS